MRAALRSALAAAALLTAVSLTPPAHAQVSSDAGLIAQLLVQEQQAVSQLKSILSTLQGQTVLIQQYLNGQPQGELNMVAGLLAGADNSYANLIGTLQTIGYTISSVNSNYSDTFPIATNYEGMTASQFPSVESGWSDEILASSQIAARSQSSLSDTQALTDAATQILQYLGSTDSTVGQLQLVTQMLGVVSQQMTMLVQNLATTGRAMVETGASTASERQLSTERKRRNRVDYTNRGNTVNVPSQMP
jgi:conjugal transfer/entry exclusion protein